MRTVIYSWNYREWGGVQIYFLSLIKRMRDKFRVIVVIPEDSAAKLVDSIRSYGAEVHFSPPAPSVAYRDSFLDRFTYRFRFFASEHRLISQILALPVERGSIVHIDLGFWQSMLAFYRLSKKFTVFGTLHTPLPKMDALRSALWSFRGRRVIGTFGVRYFAENDDARQSLRPYIGDELTERVVLTYAGFDEDEMARVESQFPGRAALNERYGLADDLLIVTFGQFIERKGNWYVLDALRTIKDRGGKFQFIWLSTAPPSGEEVERIASYGLGGSFRLMSANDFADMRSEPLSVLRAADIFLLASREEGLPIALIEAMALGRTCVVTDVNGMPEAIENGVNGILIRPKNSPEIVTAIETLASDEHLRTRLGAAARSTAFDRFNETKLAADTLREYERALAKNG